MLIELFSLPITVEALWADIGRNFAVWKWVGHFERKSQGERGVPHQRFFGIRKLESLSYRMVKKIAENFNRLSRAHQRYRQTTDRRQTTDGIAIACSECNVVTFAKNCWEFDDTLHYCTSSTVLIIWLGVLRSTGGSTVPLHYNAQRTVHVGDLVSCLRCVLLSPSEPRWRTLQWRFAASVDSCWNVKTGPLNQWHCTMQAPALTLLSLLYKLYTVWYTDCR